MASRRLLWDAPRVPPLVPLRRVVGLAGAIAVAACSAAGAAVPRDFVGIVSDDAFAGGHAYREATFAAQQLAGIGLIRQTFDWAAIERRRNHYDFSNYDAFVAAAARHGIEILPVLFDPPRFRSSRPRRHYQPGTYYPRRYADLGAFGAAVARRYGRDGTLWAEHPELPRLPITAYQVWNEPNLPFYSPPRPNARRYVRLLKATGRRIRRVDPAAEIVSAGMPDSKLSRPRIYTFLARMYRAGARGAFDTLAINPYARRPGGVLGILRRVRSIMRRHHDRRAQLWVTEMGWSDRGPGSTFRAGPRGQGQRIRRTLAALNRARRSLNLRGVIYYSWRDGRPYAPSFRDFWGLHTGLLRVNGTPKPAFAAFRRATAALTR